MTDTSESTREYVEEDGTPMRCADCQGPTYYDYADEAYHHAYHPRVGCSLIPGETREADPAHPGLTTRQRQSLAKRKRL